MIDCISRKKNVTNCAMRFALTYSIGKKGGGVEKKRHSTETSAGHLCYSEVTSKTVFDNTDRTLPSFHLIRLEKNETIKLLPEVCDASALCMRKNSCNQVLDWPG